MKPSASSATAATKPGDARVTSTPATDAALTSNCGYRPRSERRHAALAAAEDLARPFVHAIGDDDVDILRGLDNAGGVERLAGVMEPDFRQGLQAAHAAFAVILAPEIRRMGQTGFSTAFLVNNRRYAARRWLRPARTQ